MNKTIVTRFAPSPTGYLHIGGVRTALYNWLFARHHQGRFLLRIDDTDTQRNVDEAVQPILSGLKWLGIDDDEDIIYQSGRTPIYNEICDELQRVGLAYKDEKAIRFRIPTGSIECQDLVRGKMVWDEKLIKDPVIRRSDGTYLYNFATVVDDHNMGITHVLRGEEHLSNTPIQIAIFRAMDWEVPQYAHLSFICAPGSRKKLSKRDLDKFMTPDIINKLKVLGFTEKDISDRNDLNPAVLGYYQHMGYLPQAIVNYLARLGWSKDGSTEIFSVEELIKAFSLEGVNAAPASFDPAKLLWLNGEYMRKLSHEEKVEATASYLEGLL